MSPVRLRLEADVGPSHRIAWKYRSRSAEAVQDDVVHPAAGAARTAQNRAKPSPRMAAIADAPMRDAQG
jgi:hypothetical protein